MPESNPALVLFVSVKNWLTLRPLRLIIISVKRLSEGPYLKSFISRVRTKHRERFRSFSCYATRLLVEAFFLPPLHRGASTKAVNQPKNKKWVSNNDRRFYSDGNLFSLFDLI